MRSLFCGILILAVTGCASYQTQLKDFRGTLRGGEPEKAAAKVEKKAFADGDDQVVYLLEYATAKQLAKDYTASNKAFLKAEALTDIKDYHSVSRITGSMLLNQGMVQYKGDDYEKILINAMLAINFLMLDQKDAALVECRKLNDKLYKFRYEGKKKYDQNPFAFYLSALIWESDHNWDNAYIDFEKAYKLNPNIPYLKEDLIRSAKNAQRQDTAAKWSQQFTKAKPYDMKKQGEAVLIYQQGWGPQKRPNPSFPKVPKLYPTPSQTVRARFEVEGGAKEMSQEVVSITDVAIKTLDDQYAGLVASRIAGVATKAVVADQLRQKNQLLGDLAWIGLNIADQADLRQWLSLPASFQVAKIRLAPGTYRMRAVGLDRSGNPTGEESEWFEVKIKARQKQFLNWRSLK